MAFGARIRKESDGTLGGFLRSRSTTNNRVWTLPDRSVDFDGLPFFVDSYGAVGDGITDDSTAINAAIAASTQDDILVFSPGKTYIAAQPLNFTNTRILWGYGATLKRGAAIQTTITAPVAANAISIPVANASIFQIGDEVLITDATQPNGGIAQSESSLNGTNRQVITNIVGNTLTVSPSVQRAGGGSFPSGSKIFKCFNMISIPFTSQPFYIYGLTIDGNKDNNQSNYSWLINASVSRIPPNSYIKDVKFINASNENSFTDGNVIFENCIVRDSNTGITHVSKSGDLDGAIIVRGCLFDNVCIQGKTITNHSEAIVTFSNSCTNVLFDGNSVLNFNQGYVLGTMAGLSNNVQISNCPIIKGGARIFDYNETDNDRVVEGIKIFNNYFEDAGDVFISSTQTVRQGLGSDKILISNNSFKNSKLRFQYVTGVVITNNRIEFTDGGTVSTSGGILRAGGAITFREGVDVTITGNKLIDYNTTYNADINGAIFIDDAGTRTVIKSDISTSTSYIYGGRGFKISDNTIWGFAYGIVDDPSTTPSTLQYLGTTISDNTIIMRNDANAAIGIWAAPGFIVDNNTIYSNSGCDYSMRVMGVAVGSAATLNGPIVTNNRVYGGQRTIELNSTNNYNAQIHNNIVTAAITNSSANSNITGTVVMTVNQNALPLVLPRQNSGFY
jgi:hypothetical protein